MPPSARITFRLTPTLAPLVSDRVRQGSTVSDIVREALELYFGLRQPQVSDTSVVLSDTVSDDMPLVSDALGSLSDTVSDMARVLSDIQARLAALETQSEAPTAPLFSRPTPRPTLCQTETATPASPTTLPPHVLKVAEVAAEYDKLSLAELAQLLYTRNIYRAKDRTTGGDKPLNRGTLLKWLGQARAAGVL